MAQLKINSQMWRILLGLGTNVASFNYSQNTVTTPLTVFIMSGEMPAASTINTLTQGMINNTGGPYYSRILMSFTGGLNFVTPDNSTSIGDSGIVAASGTGVATWAVVALTANRLLVGDVSDIYGSAFLLINDVNINAGERYKILSMQFSMNHEYTI